MAIHIKKILEGFKDVMTTERRMALTARFLSEFGGKVSSGEISLNRNVLYIRNPLKKTNFLLKKKELLLKLKANPLFKNISDIR